MKFSEVFYYVSCGSSIIMSNILQPCETSWPFPCFSQPSPVLVKCSNLSVKGSLCRRPLPDHDLGIPCCSTLNTLFPSLNPFVWAVSLNTARRGRWGCTSCLIFPGEYHRLFLHLALLSVYEIPNRVELNKWRVNNSHLIFNHLINTCVLRPRTLE